MFREIAVTLECCQKAHRIAISDRGILAREPNEMKKNVECASCGKLVILSFAKKGEALAIEQEIIDLR